MKLDKEEKEILDAYEKEDLASIPNVKQERQRYREYAKAALQKNKRINIRISERDLIHIGGFNLEVCRERASLRKVLLRVLCFHDQVGDKP